MSASTTPRWKTAVLIWLAIYPSITLLLGLAGPWPALLPLLVRTMVLTGILVPLMVFVLLPRLQRLFGPWPRR